jgi:hypothetical protein
VAAETNESGFLIDDKLYPVPSVFSLTNDEAQILWDYSGLTIQDFLDEDADERQFDHPGVMTTLMHVAYQRGNPDMKPKKVRELIGGVTRWKAMTGLVAADDEPEEDEIPLALTSEPDSPSERRPLENDNSNKRSTGTPGNGSPNGSGEPVSHHTPTGVSRSVTRPTSAPVTSAP